MSHEWLGKTFKFTSQHILECEQRYLTNFEVVFIYTRWKFMRKREVVEWHGSILKGHLCDKTIGFDVNLNISRIDKTKNGDVFEYLHLATEADQRMLQK